MANEVVIAGDGLPGSTALANADWVDRLAGQPDDPVFLSLLGTLDQGEAAAIATAVAQRAELLLIDERKGRSAAKRLGLSVKGTLGILLAARRGGLVDALAPSIHALRASGIYLSDDLIADVLRWDS